MTLPETQPFLTPMALAAVVTMTTMAGTWWLARRIHNYGIVDAVWSFLFAPIAAAYATIGTGAPFRRALVAAMVALWSVRLGLHLIRRIKRDHPTEDRRYAALRSEWGRSADSRMLGFYQLQGILIIVLATPFLFPVFNPLTAIHPLEWSGIVVFLLGLAGESVSDSQLARFKRRRPEKNAVCESGLWHYSRHPNYFSEWLIWVGFAIFALPSPGGLIGLIAPLLMLHFLLNVTGIPMTEELAVVRKGGAYRKYQQTTSRFIPWLRKEQ
jgi:steroid 5-alpha reductase family enzyme